MIGLTTLESIAALVAKFSPLLGTVLETPMAGVAMSLIGGHFGIDPKNTDAILTRLQNDPETITHLKEIEKNHEETLLQIASENFKGEEMDRQSARQRQMALRDHVPTLLALGFLCNYAVVQFYCVTHLGSGMDMISARFQDVLMVIVSYYFGSCHKDKSHPSLPD